MIPSKRHAVFSCHIIQPPVQSRVKQLEYDVDCSCPFSAEVRLCMAYSPICLHVEVLRHRDTATIVSAVVLKYFYCSTLCG